jgi:hypothetical protein
MIAVAAIALLLFGAPSPSVLVYDETGDRIVLCRAVEHDDEFVLAFTNSMYGGDVRETYEVTRHGMLRRVAMHTAHPAAADYYAFTADVIPEGDLYRIDLPEAEFPEIAVRIDRVGAPRLIFAGGEIDLLTATGNQHRVILSGRPAGSEC